MRPVIQSEKHYVQFSPQTVALGAITIRHLVSAVAVDQKNDTDEVVEGSIIKAVYLELWLTGDDATASSQVFTVEKLSGNFTAMAVGEAAALGDYVNKKNIFFTSQGLLGPNTQVPIPVIRQWIKIPKSKQRFGLGDHLVFNLSAGLDGVTLCGMCVYKSYM